jgi:hypothetical protein
MMEKRAVDVPKVIRGDKRLIRIGSELPMNAFIRPDGPGSATRIFSAIALCPTRLSTLLHQHPLRKPLIRICLRPAVSLHGFLTGVMFDQLFCLAKFAATLRIVLEQRLHATQLRFAKFFQAYAPPSGELEHRFFHQPAIFFRSFAGIVRWDGGTSDGGGLVRARGIPTLRQDGSLFMLEGNLSRTCGGGLPDALRGSLDFQTRLFFRQLPNPQDALESLCH